MTRIVPIAALVALVCTVMFRANADQEVQYTFTPKVESVVVVDRSFSPSPSRAAMPSEASCCTHLDQVRSLEHIVAFKDAVIESERFAHRIERGRLEVKVEEFRTKLAKSIGGSSTAVADLQYARQYAQVLINDNRLLEEICLSLKARQLVQLDSP